MWTSSHSSLGLIIYKLCPNLTIGVPLAILSHYFMDTMQEYCTCKKTAEYYRIIINEALLNIGLVGYSLMSGKYLILIYLFGANFPDFVRFFNKEWRHPKISSWISFNEFTHYLFTLAFFALAVWL